MVGLVIVSHSRTLAQSLVELVRQMVSEQVPIAIAAGAGPDHLEFGTDPSEIVEAIQSVYSPDGVLVLMDLGSAVLSAEMAVELLPDEMKGRIACCAAPLVEGAIAAGVQASLSRDLQSVCQEARNALAPKIEHLGSGKPVLEGEGIRRDEQSKAEGRRSVILTLQNLHGLHARPAARFVQLAASFNADIQVRNETSGKGPVSARSLNGLATLGVVRGDRIVVSASGAEAVPALEALSRLVDDQFGMGDFKEDAEIQAAVFLTETGALTEGFVKGIPVSEGIAIGPLFFYQRAQTAALDVPGEDPEFEWGCLQRAIDQVRIAIRQRRQQLSARLGEGQASIFEAHELILQDPQLLEKAQERIFADGKNAAWAWQASINEVIADYQALTDPYLQARRADIKDVGQQVLEKIGLLCLRQKPSAIPAPSSLELPEPAILFTDELTPTEVTQLDPSWVLGLVTACGGATDHSAILARALGIPALTGIDRTALVAQSGTMVGLDGIKGVLWVNPTPEVEARLIEQRQAWLIQREMFLQSSAEPARLRDGRRIEVAANVGSLIGAKAAVQNGAEGIGVLRTEFLYLDRATPPSEEEQVVVLREIGQTMGQRPIIVRTLDVGGDKELHYIPMPVEANPFLGVRGLRLSLRQPELFLTQLRSILRAGADIPVRVMFPMVATQDEILKARQLLEEAHQTLQSENKSHRWPIEMGIMIEIPSAALSSPRLAPLVDFLSIGTNDLTQYTLAAERGNPDLAGFLDALHPSVLYLIKQVTGAAHQHGKWAGVCGEVAGDPLAAPVLIGLGVDELSMNPAEIPAVKAILRQVDLASAKRLAEKALKCENAAAVRGLARKFLDAISK